MIGIGIDIVEVERISKIISKFGSRFLNRVYTRGEIEYCTIGGARKYRFTSLAARFAAKESFYKAVFPLIRRPIYWHACEVCNDQDRVPQIRISDQLKKELNEPTIHLSLSHSEKYAIAIVMIE